MKILHISTSETWRGGEQQLAYLLEALGSAPVAGAGVDSRGDAGGSAVAPDKPGQIVFCPRGSVMQDFCKKNSIKSYTYSKKLFPLIALELIRLVRREKISLLHAHDGHAVGIAAWAAFFGLKTPQVLHRRVIFPLKKNPFSLYKYNHATVRRILCVSEAVQLALQPCLRHPGRAEVVYSCIDLKRFAEDADASGVAAEVASAAAEAPSAAAEVPSGTLSLHQQFNLPADAFLVGNVAALTEEKDYHTFIRVAEKVTARCPQARFIIVGDGPVRAELQRQVKRLQLEEKLFFTGFRKDIPHILKELDLFLTTTLSEGLGTSVLDAFAAGTPVVATAVGGIPELVEEGRSGLLADAGDAEHLAEQVLSLAHDPELRDRLRRGALEKVKCFSVEQLGRKMYEQYIKVLQQESGGAPVTAPTYVAAAAPTDSATGFSAPKLSLIIAFYNNLDCLRLIYASLRRQTFRDFEVVVADDGSRAEVVEALEKLNAAQPFPVTHCWHKDEGWRKNRILNEAVRQSRADYLVFIDGDCLLEEHFLEDHYRFRRHRQMISGRRVMLSRKFSRTITEQGVLEGRLQHLFYKFPTSWQERSSWKHALRVGRPFWRQILVHDKYKPIKGCNFSIFKADLLKVNGFDERYEARGTGEDDDLEARLSRVGIRPKSCRMAVVQYHYWHPHKESVSEENRRLKQENDAQQLAYTPYGVLRNDV